MHLAVESCRQYGPDGFCSTFVSDFGNQTDCFCDTCELYVDYAWTCDSLCDGCTYNSTLNFHTCPL